MHQIAAVRRSQDLSITHCARRLGISVQEARRQERPDSDLTISQLMAWREVLDVPFSELLLQENDFISDPIRNRAKMLKVMKFAKQIKQIARETRVQSVCKMLIEQLVEVMPELEQVAAWPDVGQSHEAKTHGLRTFNIRDIGLE